MKNTKNKLITKLKVIKTPEIILALALFYISLATINAATSENISKGKPCKAFSSIEANGWSVNKLTDGEKEGKGWSSKAFSVYPNHSLYPEYVVVDLGATFNISMISLWQTEYSGTESKGFPEDFSIQVSMEGEPWNTVVQRKGYAVPEHESPSTFKFKKTRGRFVKIEATRLSLADTGRYYFQLSEIEVFGREAKNIPLEVAVVTEKAESYTINNLRCEGEVNPLGIDVPNPGLSWWIESFEKDIDQKFYNIMVASSQSELETGNGDIWNSGRVESDNSISVPYQGKPLQSGKEYWWKVNVITGSGQDFGWSKPASFATGKIYPSDWQGIWIGANADTKHGAVYLRKELEINKPVKRAMIYFCGLGFSELSIDGQKVGAYLMAPGFTSYDKRTQYMVYDVTRELSAQGLIGLGVTLVDGWYGLGKDPWVHKFETNVYVDKPKLLLNLHIEYIDGTDSTIVSDESWRWSGGPITFSWIAQEDIDLTKVNSGWDKAGYNDMSWNPVKIMNGPAGTLVRQKEQPCRVIDEIHPVSMNYDPSTNTCKFDFSSELSGMIRFRTKGKKGQTITIKTIPLDTIYFHNNLFTLAGSNEYEVYEPRFFNIGIKHIVITGLTHTPELEDISIRIISTGWERSGSFSCSDGFINSIEDIVRRTSAYYTTFLPNDPTREWKAWTEDIENMFLSNTYLFDAGNMYRRWQMDLINDQRDDGNVPDVCPGPFFDDYNSPWWGGCVVWLPWNMYQYYGDRLLLEESYPAMKRYVDYLSSVSKEGLQDWGLADWCPIEETPRPLINTPAWYYYAEIVSKTAGITGKTEDEKIYSDLAERIKKKFNEQFLDTVTGIYGQPEWKVTPGYPLSALNGIVPHKVWWPGGRVCTQAGQVLPLALGLVPEKMVPLVENALLSEIEAHGTHLSTGFCSTPYLLQVLSDLAPSTGWKMTTMQDYPSWYSNTIGSDNYLMKEMWHGGQAFMPSLAGNIAGWIYQSMGGIRPDAPGFKRILIKPDIVGDMHWVKCSYKSVYGEIISNWQKRDKQLIMNITIPCNTTATVYIPAINIESVKENNHAPGQSRNVSFLRMEKGNAIFMIGSGNYLFSSTIE